MRLFVALDLDDAIRERLVEFVEGLKRKVPDVRFVSPESYHLTLKFLGETKQVAEIREALKTVKVKPFDLRVCGTGFFPNERAPRVFWAGIEAGGELRQLADWISSSVARLGFEREGPFKPHLTLARSGSGSPRPKSGDRMNPKLQRVRQLIANEPLREFGTMTAREFYLYESKLGPRGAQYFKVERYELVAG